MLRSQRYLMKKLGISVTDIDLLLQAGLLTRHPERRDFRDGLPMYKNKKSPSAWPKWARQIWYGTPDGKP